MKSRGLGDDIKKITSATRLDKLTEVITKLIGEDCGCNKRQEELNKYPSIGELFSKKGNNNEPK